MPHSPAPMVVESSVRDVARKQVVWPRAFGEAAAGNGSSAAPAERGAVSSAAAGASDRTAVAAASQQGGPERAASAPTGTTAANGAIEKAESAPATSTPAKEPAPTPVPSHFSEKLPHETSVADSYEKDGDPIGEGTYGTVWKAKCRRTGLTVAMKRVLIRNEKEGFPVSAIREVRALRRLDHPNIVSLLDVVAAPPAVGSTGPGDVYLIFEYAPSDLTGLLAYRKQRLKPAEIKCLIKQLANALDFCHLKSIMHRDLKPSNVLITALGVLKLCDFGLSRSYDGPGNYSTRVITLWYRPPELLLGAKHYDQRVDVWSAGCIFGELLTGHALFPESSEIKVFQKICERCNACSDDAWPADFRKLQHWDRFIPRKAPGEEPAPGSDIFSELLAKHGPTAVDLLRSTLQLDPCQRVSAQAVTEHTFFAQEPLPCEPKEIKVNQHLSCHELDVKRHREKLREEKEAQKHAKRQTQPSEVPRARPGAVSPPAKRPKGA